MVAGITQLLGDQAQAMSITTGPCTGNECKIKLNPKTAELISMAQRIREESMEAAQTTTHRSSANKRPWSARPVEGIKRREGRCYSPTSLFS